MTPEQLKQFTEEFGKQAAEQLKSLETTALQNIETKFNEIKEKLATDDKVKAEFEQFKTEQMDPLNEQLKKLLDAQKEQGAIINEMKEKGGAQKHVNFEAFIEAQWPKLKEMREAKAGGFIEFTATQLKAAGVTSIGNSVGTMAGATLTSPYLPGIGSETLELFDIRRDPNFILSKVDLGRTNQSRLAWVNEYDYQGTPGTNVLEGGEKPLIEHKFRVEYSIAKKAAAYMRLTEEFEDDAPGLATAVRRMLQNDVLRQLDTQIQTDVIAKSKLYEISQLDGQVQDANLWDAIRACIAQIITYNFDPNTVALHPITWAAVEMLKTSTGEYLTPTFAGRIQAMKVEANKVLPFYAHVSDLRQYHVDIYKEFTLRMGWINDDLIHNQFAIVGELRYHSYISDARTKALCYAYLPSVVDRIDGIPASS